LISEPDGVLMNLTQVHERIGDGIEVVKSLRGLAGLCLESGDRVAAQEYASKVVTTTWSQASTAHYLT
jgi:hypothetical protein